jgi:two-component system NarL family response regulator
MRIEPETVPAIEATPCDPPIRVAIAGDHALFRRGLASLLASRPGFAVVAEIDRMEGLLFALVGSPCDVLLLDLHEDMGQVAHIEALARRTRLLLVMRDRRLEDAAAAVGAGARGVVFDDLSPDALVDAIRTVARGGVWVPVGLRREALVEVERSEARPTGREREVIRHVALGLRNAEVAAKLGISAETVKKHLRNVFQKINVRDRVELAHYALRVGIIEVQRRAS